MGSLLRCQKSRCLRVLAAYLQHGSITGTAKVTLWRPEEVIDYEKTRKYCGWPLSTSDKKALFGLACTKAGVSPLQGESGGFDSLRVHK